MSFQSALTVLAQFASSLGLVESVARHPWAFAEVCVGFLALFIFRRDAFAEKFLNFLKSYLDFLLEREKIRRSPIGDRLVNKKIVHTDKSVEQTISSTQKSPSTATP